MSSNVEPRELAALLGGAASAAREVEPCDFRRPRRLGPAQLADLRARVEAALPRCEQELGALLGSRASLELASSSEIHADAIVASAPEPFTALRFSAGGQPCWLLWESEPAIACIERVLGAAAERRTARALSPVEARVLEGLLAALLPPLLQGLGLAPGEARLVQERGAAGGWRDAPKDPDPHRLALELALDIGGGPSSLHVFLPAPPAAARRAEPAPTGTPAALPAHLRHVEAELRVAIAAVEIPLSQLLELEEGDVIPVDARVGDPVRASIDGRTVAAGTWGLRDGRQVVRIEQLGPCPEEER